MKKQFLLGIVVFIVMTSFFQIKGLSMSDKEFICADATKLYSVDEIVTNNDLKNLNCFSSFSEAKAFFNETIKTKKNIVIRFKNSTAPNKIVQMDHGYAVATTADTVSVYRNPDMIDNTNSGNISTYVTHNVKLHYYDTVLNSSGTMMYKVQVSGYVGYINSNHSDLLPWIYVENDFPFTLRYYNLTRPYTKTDANHFVVKSDASGKRELFYYSGVVGGPNYEIGPYALAPEWLPNGVYYSDNSIQFYSDFQLTKPINNGKKFYNYFQYLPLRTRSNITGAQMDKFLQSIGMTNSVYYGQSSVFVENQNRYGMNALLIYAMAGLESAYGTSYYAKNRNNLFGWLAFDSNPDNAQSFSSVSQSIKEHMSINLFGYTNINDGRFSSPSLGNKGAGFNTKYASDPDWGLKIASIAYRVDKANGYPDLNYYALGILNDNTNVGVRSSASTTASQYYHTMGGTKALINQPVAITRSVADMVEVTTWFPIIDGVALTNHNAGNYINNVDTSLGYVPNTLVQIQNEGRYAPLPPGTLQPSQLTPPPAIEIIDGEKGQFRIEVQGVLNVREQPTTSSNIIGTLGNGAVIDGTYVNNNTWIRIVHSGKTGYIASAYAVRIDTPPPVVEEPPVTTTKTYRVNASAGLRVREEPNTTSAILGLLENNATFEGSLTADGAWVQLTYQNKTGYVSKEFVIEVDTTPNEGQIKVAETLGYSNVNGTLTGMNLSTTIASMEQKLKAVDSSITISVVNASGTAKANAANLATGDKVTINQANQSAQTFSVAVKGDLNGDGRINSSDYVTLANHILKKVNLDAVKQVAADLTNDNRINSSDYVRIANHILGKNPLY